MLRSYGEEPSLALFRMKFSHFQMMYKTWCDLTSAITRYTFSVPYFLCVYNFAHILLSVNLCWNSRITSMITSPFVSLHCCCCCSVTKLCPTCCNPMDCSTPGFPVLHWLLEFAQIQVNWVGCHFLLQGIFPTQELNPCLLHYRWILYHWVIQEAQVFIEPLHFESESIWHLCSSVCVCSVTWSCPTLCAFMDCSPRGSCVHGIFQTRILKWVVISFSRGSSQSWAQTCISCNGSQILYLWAIWEALVIPYHLLFALLVLIKLCYQCTYLSSQLAICSLRATIVPYLFLYAQYLNSKRVVVNVKKNMFTDLFGCTMS